MSKHRGVVQLSMVLLVLVGLLSACGGGEAATTTEGGAVTTGGQVTTTTAGQEATTTTAAQEPTSLVAFHGSSPDFIALVPAAAWDVLAGEGVEVDQQYVEDREPPKVIHQCERQRKAVHHQSAPKVNHIREGQRGFADAFAAAQILHQ